MSYRTIEATNTKTRRLAYVQVLVTILNSGKFTKPQLLEKIARWSEENTQNLNEYWVETGQISSTRQNSAGSRYIDLATSLGLIASISGVYRYTRLGRVLLTLGNIGVNFDNPFFLSPASKLFFAYVLLSKDADFILLISDYVLRNSNISLAQMQRDFRQLFLERINAKIAISVDERTRRTLLDRRSEVENWKKPERYAEHLIPPRLNWLLDLGLLKPIDFAQHRYLLTDIGLEFFGSVPLQNLAFRDIDDVWLQTSFWSAVSRLAKPSEITTWQNLDEATRLEKSADLLKLAFRAFRVTNVPRISLSQSLLYICISLSLKGIVVSSQEFADWLSSNQNILETRYEIRHSPRENEAYIVARPR